MKGALTRDLASIRTTIEEFLLGAREPALLEPGEELLRLTSENYALEMRASRLTLQAWDRTRNWTRRVTAISESTNARLAMTVERFARREGQLYLLDLGRRSGVELSKRTGRLVFRERFRIILRRQFPGWTLAEISAEADLEHTLSPSYPRAFLKHGQHAWAAMACPVGGDSAGVLSFGLIWLDYLRSREKRVTVAGLALFLPAGCERAAALRLLCLDPESARFEIYTYDDEDSVAGVDVQDYGNLDTRLDACRSGPMNAPAPWQQIADLPGVEHIPRHDGRTSLRVRGIEFAELSAEGLFFGISSREPAKPYHAAEITRLVEELDRARCAGSDRDHPLYRQYPEAWLESLARGEIQTLDARLRPAPVYGQVPAFAAGERGVLDLLAVDLSGRLTVIELKATADLHLPLQALDYWIRVKWHLDRGEFTSNGYFPGIPLLPDPPRLLLVAPALEFHPSTETLLSFFAPLIEVERVGLAVEWRKGLQVLFRLTGANRPE